MALIVITLLLGIALAWIPRRVIDMQIALYRVFNWDIKPVSMDKEIRNMRIAGIIAVAVSTVAFMWTVVCRGG